MSERRRMMMVGNLPYDAEIEYLQSSGSQFIEISENTNITKVEIKFQMTSSHRNQRVFDASVSVSGLNAYQNGSNYLAVSINSDWVSTNISYSKLFILIMDGQNKKSTVYYDNTSKVITHSVNPVYVNVIKVFGNGSDCPLYGKIYYLKFYSGENLLCDAIPVRVGNVGYMYDKVSKRLFGNAGTGNFTLGSDVN